LLELRGGYGHSPVSVSGDDPPRVHQQMAAAIDWALDEISRIQKHHQSERPTWPMIVLRTPKGWTGPKTVDGLQVEGTWRAHQVPVGDVRGNPSHLALLDSWMHRYRPEELFDERGAVVAEISSLAPKGARRMSANRSANGGEPL